MSEQHKSVYKSGADDGFILGAYLSVWFLLLGYSTENIYLAPLAMLMMLGVPVVIFFMLRRAYVRAYGLSQFSELWLQGIITFVCGTLLMGVVAYVFLRYLNPGFIMNQASVAAGYYASLPGQEARSVAHALQVMIDRNMLPEPIYVVFQMILLGVFSGSMLSMVATWIVRRIKVRSRLDDITPGD